MGSRLRLPDGSEETLVTDVVITAVGAFTTPKWPPIAGLRDFDGPVVHTSQWDPSVDLAGKRVAVIGNGASAMQLVPAIADTVRLAHRLPAVKAVGRALPQVPQSRCPSRCASCSAKSRTTSGSTGCG